MNDLFGDDLVPPWLDAELWVDFVEGRAEKARTKMTERAKKRMLIKLERWHAEGIDVNECLERSAINGWKDVYKPEREHDQTADSTIRDLFAQGYRLDLSPTKNKPH